MAKKPEWFKEWEENHFFHLRKEVIKNKKLVYLALVLLFAILVQTEGVEGLVAMIVRIILG